MATKKKATRNASRKAPARKAARKTLAGSARSRLVRKVIEVAVQRRHAVPIPASAYGQAGQFVWGSAVVGAESRHAPVELSYKLSGLNLQNVVPAAIFLQARQSDNTEYGWTDVFGTQVVQTDRDFMEVRVIRLDQQMDGWGQQLQLDYFIVDVPA